MELRTRPEPVLSGLFLACLLGLEEEMGKEFQARNFEEHGQGTMKLGHPNRAEHVVQKICPEYHGSAPGLFLGNSGGGSWCVCVCLCLSAQLTDVLLNGEPSSVCPRSTVVSWSGGEALELWPS